MASRDDPKKTSEDESEPAAQPTKDASPAGSVQQVQDQSSDEADFEERVARIVQSSISALQSPRPRPGSSHYISDSDWEQDSSEDSDSDTVTFAARTKHTKKKGKHKTDSSEGDKYTRARKKETTRKRKVKKSKKKKKKKSKSSSSDSENDSSSTSSDSDTAHAGKYARTCNKESRKVLITADKKVRICTLMRKAIQGHFDTFKPVEIISKAAERYTGIKGIRQSFAREMDKEVNLNEEKKKFENVLYTVHRGVLTSLSALAPIANRMMVQNKFTSLSDDMNRAIALLAATSNFLGYRRFENVYKSVCTDAGKEVAKSQKVKDNQGKEFTLFLAPEPIKGKPIDHTKMFGGQLPLLFKQVETGTKCGKHLGKVKTADDKISKLKDFRHRRTFSRGAKFSPRFTGRGRAQRQSYGWTDYNRPGAAFRGSNNRPHQPAHQRPTPKP